MANLALYIGIALVVLGVAGYLGSGGASMTALIPALFGLLIAVSGVLARNPAKRKLWMHVAVGVALLGFLGSISGVRNTFAMMGGQTVARPAAAIAQAVMALLCLAFIVPAIKSFVDARRTR